MFVLVKVWLRKAHLALSVLQAEQLRNIVYQWILRLDAELRARLDPAVEESVQYGLVSLPKWRDWRPPQHTISLATPAARHLLDAMFHALPLIKAKAEQQSLLKEEFFGVSGDGMAPACKKAQLRLRMLPPLLLDNMREEMRESWCAPRLCALTLHHAQCSDTVCK
jgi:hypothetical protein